MAMIVAPWERTTKRGKGSVVEVLESFAVLTLAAVIFRLEILAFLAPLAFESLGKGIVKFDELVIVGAAAAAASLGALFYGTAREGLQADVLCWTGVTVSVDSYFWGKWVWPEGAGIMFNVVEGHSSDWGVCPPISLSFWFVAHPRSHRYRPCPSTLLRAYQKSSASPSRSLDSRS